MQIDAQTISINEAAELLGIGRDAVRSGIRDGEIPTIEVGKHIRVCLPALMRKLNGDAVDEAAIARKRQMSDLQSAMLILDVQRAEIARQIEILNDRQDAEGLSEWVDHAQLRRRYQRIVAQG